MYIKILDLFLSAYAGFDFYGYLVEKVRYKATTKHFIYYIYDLINRVSYTFNKS